MDYLPDVSWDRRNILYMGRVRNLTTEGTGGTEEFAGGDRNLMITSKVKGWNGIFGCIKCSMLVF
jgi:hypothetical protein